MSKKMPFFLRTLLIYYVVLCSFNFLLAADLSQSEEAQEKRVFKGGDFAKWEAGKAKWEKRRENRSALKAQIEKLAGAGADEWDANIVLISSFNEYLASKKAEEAKTEGVVSDQEALSLLGKELFRDIFPDDGEK